MSQAEGVVASAAKAFSISKYTNYIEIYQDKVLAKRADAMVMPFLSNHDMDRIAGAFVTEGYMRMAANLYLLSPGSPVIYYGEELGMRGSRGSANTDANRRLAMLWGDDDLIKDPIGATYAKSNQIDTTVAEQTENEESLLNYYRELIRIRHRYPAIARGDYNSVTTAEKNLGGFIIEYNGASICLLHNTSSEAITIDLADIKGLEEYTFKKLCDSIGMGEAKLKGSTLTIGAQSSVILK
jgi:glycosidase